MVSPVTAVLLASRCALLATVIAGGLLATGCGDKEPERRSPATASPTARPAASTPAPPGVPAGRPVRFHAIDGVRLRGSLLEGAGRRSPAVVLVHQSDGGPDQFDEFLPYLHAEGYATLSYTSRPLPGRMDEVKNARDIAGAIGMLRRRSSIDPDRLAVLGASIGAGSAARLSFTKLGRSLPAIIGLSPSSFLDDPPRGRRPHDVLLISDKSERINADFIADGSPGITVEISPIAGHGVELLPNGRIREDVLGWLRPRLAR